MSYFKSFIVFSIILLSYYLLLEYFDSKVENNVFNNICDLDDNRAQIQEHELLGNIDNILKKVKSNSLEYRLLLVEKAKLLEENDPQSSIQYFEQFHDLSREIGDTISYHYLISIFDFAMFLERQQEYTRELQILESIYPLSQKILKFDSKDYMIMVDELGRMYHLFHRYEESWDMKLIHLDVINSLCLNNTVTHSMAIYGSAAIQYDLYNNELSLYYYKESLRILEDIGRKNTYGYWSSQIHMTRYFDRFSDLEGGFDHTKMVRVEVEKLFGTKHTLYAMTSYKLGVYYMNKGWIKEANGYFDEAISIYSNLLDTESPMHSLTHYSKALNYLNAGQFEIAEPLFEKYLNLESELQGEFTKFIRSSPLKIVKLYADMGILDKAHDLLDQYKMRTLEVFGYKSKEYVNYLEQSAMLKIQKQEYSKANQELMQALDLINNHVVLEQTQTARLLRMLSSIYLEEDVIHLSNEDMVLKSLNLHSKIYSEDDPSLVEMRHVYARYLFKLGDIEPAIAHTEDVVLIFAKGSYINPYKLSSIMLDLAEMYAVKCNSKRIDELCQEVYLLLETNLPSSTSYLSDIELELFIQNKFNPLVDRMYNIYINNHILNIRSQKLLYNLAILSKTLYLKSTKRINEFLADNKNEEFKKFIHQLTSINKSIGIQKQKLYPDSISLSILYNKKEKLEKKLKLISHKDGEGAGLISAKTTKVCPHLKANEVAIEFIRYNQSGTYFIGALIIGSNQTVKFESIGDEDAIIEMLSNKKSNGFCSACYQDDSLSNFLFNRIEKYFSNITDIYISPVGILHVINFGALPISENQYLIDKYNVIRVFSTSSIFNKRNDFNDNQAVVIGGVNFDYSAKTSYCPKNLQIAMKIQQSIERDIQDHMRGTNFEYLRWTEEEAKDVTQELIKTEYQVNTYIGPDASEYNFKMIDQTGYSPKVIHIATHGFTFEKNTTLDSEISQLNYLAKDDQPMFRSGLLLAGVKNENKDLNLEEDGILTSFEIGNMNLSNTDLVVLSACSTGLGEIKNNGIVDGLSRAFKKAGVDKMIVSLWEVSDAHTSKFMTAFYKNWNGKHHDVNHAYRNTQLEMKEKYSDPMHWGAFILIQ